MVKDRQVRILMKLINQEKTLELAAAKAGMSEKTARKYHRLWLSPYIRVSAFLSWSKRMERLLAWTLRPHSGLAPRFVAIPLAASLAIMHEWSALLANPIARSEHRGTAMLSPLPSRRQLLPRWLFSTLPERLRSPSDNNG